MTVPWPVVREAVLEDAARIAIVSFGGEPWQQEVEAFVRSDALACHVGEKEPEHRLLVGELDDELVALMAWRDNVPVEIRDHSVVLGTLVVFFAIAEGFQGESIEDGPKLSHYLMQELLADIGGRQPPGEQILGIIDYRNIASRRLSWRFRSKAVPFGAVDATHDLWQGTLGVMRAADPLAPIPEDEPQ